MPAIRRSSVRHKDQKMEMHAFILSILLLTLLTGSEARSVDQLCSEKCTNGIRQFFVKDDYEYSYTYLTTVESSFHTDSAHDQKAQLSIEVPFSILTSSDCNLVLQVKNGIYIDNRTPRTEEELAWQEAITANPLHFSWQTGVVEDVCPSINEPIWVTNFKRGILSAMQVSTTRSHAAVKELDVSGECEAEYYVEDGRTTIIRKTKDYNKCTNRNKHLLFSWSLPYDLTSPRQNYIHSTQICHQEISDVLTGVDCTEEHVLRPFSTDEAGARTKITQRVTFQSQRRIRSIPYSRGSIRRSDLSFEEESELVNGNMEEKTQAAKDLLTQICGTMDGEQYQNVGKEFITLVHAIRQLDAESLTELNAHADTCTEWSSALKQMLANTLPFCGTESCVSFATSLMTENALDKMVAERWLTGFGLIKKPTEEMISSILDIVESRRYPEQSFLAIGSMIHQFCQNSEDDCMNNRVIRSSLEVLMQHLGTNCRSTNSDTRKMSMLALRAIGNAGQTTSSSTLKRCVEESDNPMEVRVAAANTYRRMSCRADRSALLTTLQNSDDDSEIRITSYVNLMQCPTSELITTVKNMLETEENMQVGSFISSHLTQIMESQDPLKHFFQVLLQGHTFKDFSLDPRKYSKYYEASLFSEKFNSGGSAEANLIWSPKSFVPRGASVNFTLDLFGQAINLLEFGGRIEGAENYLQSILEPKAYEKRKERKGLEPFGSERRRNTGSGRAADKAHASWFMRAFGNELIYGNTEMMEPIETESPNFFSDVMAKFMSDDGYTYHDDALILNSIHTLPTGNGLPLQVAFNGSTTVDVNAAGRFNMGFGLNAEYLVRGKVTPRAAVVMIGSMTVDAHVRRTGVASESIAYSSTSLSGFVKISDGGNTFEFELDSPYDKNMAFNFNHKLLKIEGETVSDMGGRTPSLTLNEDISCTDEYLGQRLCFNKRHHDARYFNGETSSYVFPTNGEVELSAYMEKMDQGLSKYSLTGNTRTQYENEDDTIPTNLLLALAFDTPGSLVNRKSTTFFSYSIPEKQISIRAQQGDVTLLQLQGEYLSGDGSNGIRISAEVKEEIYRFEANMRRTYEENRKQVATDVTIEMPANTMTINGMMDYHVAERFQASFEMNNVLPTPVVMKIDLQDNSESQDALSFSGEGKLTILPFVNSEFVVGMDLTPRLDNMVFNLNYKIGGSPKQTVLFHHKRTNLGRNGETDWTVNQMFTASQFTALNHKALVSHKYSKGSTTSNLEIGFGAQMEEPDNEYRLELRQEYHDTSDTSTTRVNGKWAIEFPYGEISRELSFQHERNPDIVSLNINNVVAGNPYHFEFLWKNNIPGSNLRNEKLEVSLYPTTMGEWRFINTLEEVVKNVYEARSSLSLGNIEALQFVQETTFTNKETNKSIEFYLRKDNDSGIVRASSVNYAVGENKYVSKNRMHVIGYTPRGLDFTHDKLPTGGCKTTVNFIKDSNVFVGFDFTTNPTETGRHNIFAARKYDVSERTILAKFGYDYIPETLFSTYTTLTDDDVTRFAFRTKTQHSEDDGWTGRFELAAKGHPSLSFSQNIDSNTTISYAIGDVVEIDYSHRCKDKKFRFTAVTADNGVHGVVQHNYCDYLNDATYNFARTSNGVNAAISSGGRQAHASVSATKNMLKMTWDHQRMPDLLEFSVPTEIDVTLQRNPENTPTNLRAAITVDRQTLFDVTYTSNRPENASNQFNLSNKLFTVLPSSANFAVTSSGEVLDINAALNDETMKIVMTNNFPTSGAIVITHDFEMFEMVYIPNDFKFSYDSSFQPGSTHLNFVLGDKVITVDANMYSDFHYKVDFVTQGIEQLPRKVMIEGQGEHTDTGIGMTGTAQYNDKTYGLDIKATSAYKKGTTFMPYLESIGTSKLSINILEDSESKWDWVASTTTAEDEISQRFEIQQTLTDMIPASMVAEQAIVVRDNEFSITRSRTENGVKVEHFEFRYVPGTVSLTQNYMTFIPESTILTYNVGIANGRITVTCEVEKTQTASLSYAISEQSGFDIRASHDFDIISGMVPSPIKFTGSMQSEGTGVEGSYTWGEAEGSMRFWKNGLWNMGMETNSNDFSVNFTYHLTENGIKTSCQVRYKDHECSSKFDGGFDLNDDSTMLKSLHGDVDFRVDDKYWISTNYVELKKKALFVNFTSEQSFTTKIPPECHFTRTFNWGMTDNSISFQIDGTKGDPFYLKVELSHDDGDSATIEMHHSQDSWEDIPKTFIAKVERTQQDQSYEAKMSITMDETTTSATASLSYTSSNTGGSLDATFVNEFSDVPYLPQRASLSASGSMGNSVIDWKFTAICDDKVYNETGNVNYAGAPTQFSFKFLQNQNICVILPQTASVMLSKTPKAVEFVITYDNKKVTFRIDLTDSGVTIAATEMTDTEMTPYNMGLRWSKEPKRVEFTHDIDQLAPIPRNLAVQGDMNDENLHITIGADSTNSDFSIRKVSDGNTAQLLLDHNLALLSPIPTSARLAYQKSPQKATLVWEENEITLERVTDDNVDQLLFQHNLDNLAPIPTSAQMTYQKSPRKVVLAWGENEFSLNQVSDDNTHQFLMAHNFDILSPIPTSAQLTYQKSPQKVTLTWEENEISLEQKEMGFEFNQNALETLPKVVSFSTDFDLTSRVKMVECSAAVDDYSTYYKMTLQTEDTYSMTLLWEMSSGDESLFHLDMSTEVTGTQGSESIEFTQSLCDRIPSSYRHSLSYNLGKTAGMISFETGTEEPITMKITYSDVEGMSLRYGLVHNLESIASIFPYHTTGEASVEWSETTKTVRATVLSKEISFSLVTDFQNEEQNIVASVSHDFDIIETALFIPKSAKLSLHASAANYEALVTYTIESKEKHVKFHTTVEESEIQFTLDQNVIEPTPSTYSRRRPQIQYPQKVSLRLVSDGDTCKSFLSFKTGLKRRYFDIEYTATASPANHFWRLKVNQNLNKIVRAPLPKATELSINVNSTAAVTNVQWDDNNFDFVAWLDRSENFEAGIKSSHNVPEMSEKGIPTDFGMSIKKSDDPYLVIASNYGQEYAVGITVVQPFSGTENTVTITTKAGEIDINSATTLAFQSNGFTLRVQGTQTGLDDDLPSNFHLTAAASYDKEARSAEFSSSHNMDVLLGLGYPKSLVANTNGPTYYANTVSGGYTFNADELKSEHSGEFSWAKTTNGYEITWSGVRTRNLYSTVASDRLTYNGRVTAELDHESEQKTLKWIYEHTENEMDEIVLQHNAHIMGTMQGQTVTWGIAATIPPFLAEGFTVTGTLTFDADFSFNTEYRRGDYHVSVNLSGVQGENFKFGIVNKYGEIALVFDKTRAEQLTFTHNIELMRMIPTSIVVALDTDAKTASIHATLDNREFIVSVEQYLFKTTYTSNNEEIVNIHSEYSSHPTQKVSCVIKITPLNVDYTTNLEMQFFRPEDGKSFINFFILDNRSRRGLTTAVHAFLQDSDIRDINCGASIISNFTTAPLNFAFEFSLGHRPLAYNFGLEVEKYSAKVNGTSNGCTVVLKLPRYYKVNELLLESTYSRTEGSSESNMLIQWNRNKKIGYKTAAGWTEDFESHWVRYEIYQPFASPTELTAGYEFEKRNGWYVVTTTITDDGRPFVVATKYKQSGRKSITRKLVVDIKQSYVEIIPTRSVTTGVITVGSSLYDSDWRITTGGEDIVTLKKHFEGTDEGYNTRITWTHPFGDLPFTSFDGSLNWQLGSDSLTVTSELLHSEIFQYFPKQLTTTGRVTKNDMLYENDWKVTSNNEDLIVYYEKIERRDSGVHAEWKWKHPFEDYFLSQFDETTDVEISDSSMTVRSEIMHSGNNKYIPPNFVVIGTVAYGDVYDSDWKVVSEGEELVTLKNVFRQIENGHQVTFNWKQPYEEFGLTNLDVDTTLVLVENTMDLTVDIAHSLDHPHIPIHFITTGVVTVGEKLYDSDWRITSGGEDLVILKKLFRGTDDGFNMEMHWKQPFDKLVVKSIDSNVAFTQGTTSSQFTGTVQYNDDQEWSTDCSWVQSSPYSRNYTIGFTPNGQRHESKFYYSARPWKSTGNTLTIVYDNKIPEDCMLAEYVPAQQHFDLTTFRKGINMQFKSTYSASILPNPVKTEGSLIVSQGTTMLDTSFGFKNSPKNIEQMDGEVKLNIDRVTGVTVDYKVPALGVDHSINVKYDQQTKQITISYMRSGHEPIVVTINLSEFIPRMKQIIEKLKQKDIIPELKIVGDLKHDSDSFEAYVGVRVRDTAYTIHLTSGYANEEGYLNITTKRNEKVLDTILSIRAKLIDQETAQIQIQTSKKLGRYMTYALTSSSSELKDKVVIIADTITELLQSLDGTVQGSEVVERTIDAKRTMLLHRVAQAKDISIQFIDSTNTGILDTMENGQEEISSGLWKAITALSAGVDKLIEIVNRPLQELKEVYLTQISTEVFTSVAQPLLQPVVNVLNKFHTGQLLLELVQEGITKSVFMMEKNAEALLNAAKEPLTKLVLVTDDTVIFNVPLHVPVKGMIAPPSMGDIAMWIAQSSLSHEVKSKLEILYQALDLYYQYRSVLNMPFDELVPPFKGHAEISGFRHVRTFDGKRYDYKSTCGSKHVLARDIIDNEFAVLVTYGSRPSIEIVTLDSRGGEETIVLKPDYSVTDERGREMVVPNEYEDVLVKRVGEILSVRTTYGLVVSCNFKSDICTVDVSPFYFARLGGMLGTFNNEPDDDYTAPAMVKVSDSEELALAWMQPGSCSGNNEQQRCSERGSESCTELFEGRDSIFSACFPVEDPTPYKQMCSKDSCSSNGICATVASYARRCALRGVNLPTPPSCMNCIAVGGDSFGSTQEMEVRGADVVFVIEKSACMRFRKKEYKKLVGEIHTTLNSTIATGNINYAIVGFGGPESLAEPHTVTFGNEIFMHPESYDLSNAEEKTILGALKRGDKTKDEPSDILQALTYASQLPFRAGAARTIILITCNDCSGDSEIHTSYVRGLLQEQGVVVHHLRQQNIQAGRSAKKVYGFNTREIFSKSSGPNMPRRELKISGEDKCLPLTDMTGGSVWNSNIFSRESLGLLAGEISNGVGAASTQECVCGISEYGTATAKCTSTWGRR